MVNVEHGVHRECIRCPANCQDPEHARDEQQLVCLEIQLYRGQIRSPIIVSRLSTRTWLFHNSLSLSLPRTTSLVLDVRVEYSRQITRKQTMCIPPRDPLRDSTCISKPSKPRISADDDSLPFARSRCINAPRFPYIYNTTRISSKLISESWQNFSMVIMIHIVKSILFSIFSASKALGFKNDKFVVMLSGSDTVVRGRIAVESSHDKDIGVELSVGDTR